MTTIENTPDVAVPEGFTAKEWEYDYDDGGSRLINGSDRFGVQAGAIQYADGTVKSCAVYVAVPNGEDLCLKPYEASWLAQNALAALDELKALTPRDPALPESAEIHPADDRNPARFSYWFESFGEDCDYWPQVCGELSGTGEISDIELLFDQKPLKTADARKLAEVLFKAADEIDRLVDGDPAKLSDWMK